MVKKIGDPTLHKGLNLIKFFSRSFLSLLAYTQRELAMETFHPEIGGIFDPGLDLYNTIGNWIFGKGKPEYIYPPLNSYLDHLKSIKVESFTEDINYNNWVCKDLLMVLEEHGIPKTNTPDKKIQLSERKKTGHIQLWRMGAMCADLSEMTNISKIQVEPIVFNAFDNMFETLGGWIYGKKDFEDVKDAFQYFEEIIDLEHDPTILSVINLAKIFREGFSSFLSEK